MERIAALEQHLLESNRRLVTLCGEVHRVTVATEMLAQAVKNIMQAISAMGETLPGEQPIRRNH